MTEPKLTPTEDLIVEVLTARHRLGETDWPIDSRLRPQLRSLAAKGMVSHQPGRVENTETAWLVERAGLRRYEAPIVRQALDQQRAELLRRLDRPGQGDAYNVVHNMRGWYPGDQGPGRSCGHSICVLSGEQEACDL